MIVETFTLPATAGSERMDTTVSRMLPFVPPQHIRKAFENRDVKMNGVRVTRDTLALPGATVAVYLPETIVWQSPPILYEDQNLMVIHKPVGVSCDEDEKGGLTVGDWVYRAHTPRLATPPLPCHRLDNPTDGLLLLAKDERTRDAMIKAFYERRVQKRYQCLVRGIPKPPGNTLNAYLLKDAKNARVRVIDHPMEGALPIRTEYRTLVAAEVSRLEIAPHTGRTHQIRAQMAHIGHPLLGDDKYGDREFNRAHHAKRLMLTATSLHFTMDGVWAYLNDLHFSLEPKF